MKKTKPQHPLKNDKRQSTARSVYGVRRLIIPVCLMKFSALHQAWRNHLCNRNRLFGFFRFLLHRFASDHLFHAASALAYTTAFALVPLAVVVFGVLSAFPVFERWSGELSDFVFSHFVPSAARAAEGWLRQFSASAGQLTAAGFIALVVSLLITLESVEQTFNRIWRITTARPRLTRFLVYWTVLTLGAMLAAASLAVSARVLALPLFGTPHGRWLANMALWLSPLLIELTTITLMYRVVPHHTVKWRHAIPGALLAVIVLALARWAMGWYLGSFQSYQKLYGAVAFVPILLLWIYIGWLAILLGASLASALDSFHYQPRRLRLPKGAELYGLLRLLGRFQHARRSGQGLDENRIQQLEPMLSSSVLHMLLERMEAINLLRPDINGQWLLARDLDQVTLHELYESARLRIPAADQPLPLSNDALGQAASQILDELRTLLQTPLQRRLSEIY